jgi:hypothetical protein
MPTKAKAKPKRPAKAKAKAKPKAPAKRKAPARARSASQPAWPVKLRGNALLKMRLALSEFERAESDRKRLGVLLSVESGKPVHAPLLILQAQAGEAGRQVIEAKGGLAAAQLELATKFGIKPEAAHNLSFDPDSGAVFLAK